VAPPRWRLGEILQLADKTLILGGADSSAHGAEGRRQPGCAACSVVVSHMTGFETKNLERPSIEPCPFRLSIVGVDFFFVLSGFTMSSMSAARAKQRVYPNHWAWSVPGPA